MDDRLVTSTINPCASAPPALTAAMVSSILAWSRSQTITIAPSRPNLSAVAWPMPRPAPVMMDTLPCSRMISLVVQYETRANVAELGGADNRHPRSCGARVSRKPKRFDAKAQKKDKQGREESV